MTLEEELEQALAAAAGHARPGERAAAAMPSEPRPGRRVYLAAFEGGDEIGYVVVDAEGRAVSDRDVVRDTVSMLALAERAEEVAGAVAADALVAEFSAASSALAAAGRGAAAAAADRVVAAVRTVAEEARGPRVATPAYLDRMAARAAELAEAVDAFAGEAAALPSDDAGDAGAAEAAWRATAAMARAGDPANFARSMTAAGGALEALLADVESGYRGTLR